MSPITGAMTNRERKSASPASTWFGGTPLSPSAFLASASTTKILVKAVVMSSSDGCHREQRDRQEHDDRAAGRPVDPVDVDREGRTRAGLGGRGGVRRRRRVHRGRDDTGRTGRRDDGRPDRGRGMRRRGAEDHRHQADEARRGRASRGAAGASVAGCRWRRPDRARRRPGRGRSPTNGPFLHRNHRLAPRGSAQDRSLERVARRGDRRLPCRGGGRALRQGARSGGAGRGGPPGRGGRCVDGLAEGEVVEVVEVAPARRARRGRARRGPPRPGARRQRERSR